MQDRFSPSANVSGAEKRLCRLGPERPANPIEARTERPANPESPEAARDSRVNAAGRDARTLNETQQKALDTFVRVFKKSPQELTRIMGDIVRTSPVELQQAYAAALNKIPEANRPVIQRIVPMLLPGLQDVLSGKMPLTNLVNDPRFKTAFDSASVGDMASLSNFYVTFVEEFSARVRHKAAPYFRDGPASGPTPNMPQAAPLSGEPIDRKPVPGETNTDYYMRLLSAEYQIVASPGVPQQERFKAGLRMAGAGFALLFNLFDGKGGLPAESATAPSTAPTTAPVGNREELAKEAKDKTYAVLLREKKEARGKEDVALTALQADRVRLTGEKAQADARVSAATDALGRATEEPAKQKLQKELEEVQKAAKEAAEKLAAAEKKVTESTAKIQKLETDIKTIEGMTKESEQKKKSIQEAVGTAVQGLRNTPEAAAVTELLGKITVEIDGPRITLKGREPANVRQLEAEFQTRLKVETIPSVIGFDKDGNVTNAAALQKQLEALRVSFTKK